MQQNERTNVWTNITDEDIEKASDEIDQGEMGGMDMGGFPGMGGDEPTDGPQGPEEGEQVETTALPTKDARGLNHAVRDFWDPMKHPRDPGGLFMQADGTGGGGGESNKKQNLNKASNNANIQQGAKVPKGLKKIYREELVGCSLKGMGRLKAVSDHSCDQIYRRGGALDDLKEVMALGERTVDVVHGGYIYSHDGIKVCVTDDGILKTIISKKPDRFNYPLYDKLTEALNGK